MIDRNLISIEMEKEALALQPDYDKIKSLVMSAFNSENNENYDLEKGLSPEEEVTVIRWMNSSLFENDHPMIVNLFLKKIEVKIPNFSPSLSSKISSIAQYHCPLCSKIKVDGLIKIIPIRIAAISKQATAKSPKMRKAFESAIKSRFENKEIEYLKNENLCVLVVFVMGKNNKNKDLDNMSKAFMDALQGSLFESDMDIVHSNLIKVKHIGDEDFIYVNIRKSSLNENKDVMFPIMNHGWAGQDFLNLEDFM